MKLPMPRRKRKEIRTVPAVLPDKNKIIAAVVRQKLREFVVPVSYRIVGTKQPYRYELPAVVVEKRITPEIKRPLQPAVVSYKVMVGRILRTIQGPHKNEELAEIDVSAGTRLFILGASGAGKTNLCKVIIEEYYKNTPANIFVFDMESEYPLMAKPQEDENLISLLTRYGLEPQGFPVRVLSLGSVLEDEEFRSFLQELGVEKTPVKIDPQMISSDMLQLLAGATTGAGKTYCDTIIRAYREAGDFSFLGLEKAIANSGVPPSFEKRIVLTLEGLRGLIAPFDVRSLLADRKINVFFFPAEFFPSASERVFWAVFFANFVMSLAYTLPDFSALAVMDEAGEFARGEITERMVKTNIAGLYRRGRKRRIDSVISTNVGGVLEDVKMNIRGAFYLRIPETAFSRSMMAKAVVRPGLEDIVSSLKEYQAVMDFPAEGETYVIAIRPAQSFLPVRKKPERREEGTLVFHTG